MPSSSLTCLDCVSKLHFLKNPLVSVTFQRPKNAKPSTAKYWWMFSPDQTVVMHKEFYSVCTIPGEKLRSYQATEGPTLRLLWSKPPLGSRTWRAGHDSPGAKFEFRHFLQHFKTSSQAERAPRTVQKPTGKDTGSRNENATVFLFGSVGCCFVLFLELLYFYCFCCLYYFCFVAFVVFPCFCFCCFCFCCLCCFCCCFYFCCFAPLLELTLDGRNPAPVDMVNIPLSTRFHTSQESQMVQDFFHQQYH